MRRPSPRLPAPTHLAAQAHRRRPARPCSAKKFDEHPALKALICRNVGEPLPLPLDDVVAAYLGGPGRMYFWPAPGPAEAMQSVEEAVRIAFRFPVSAVSWPFAV
jgi:hypothetical protein